MKTTLDATNIGFDVINVTELTESISGQVYHQGSRPANSSNEDVVVNSLSISDGHVQKVVLNINVYVPDAKKAGDEVIYQVPNRERLAGITSVITTLLNGNSGRYWKDGSLAIELISNPIPVPEMKQHYVNIRVKMRLHGNYN